MTRVTPPEVGQKFWRIWKDGTEDHPHHVRAVVDTEQDTDGRWHFHVVMRWYSHRKGWQYIVESSIAFEVGLYVTERKVPTGGHD